MPRVAIHFRPEAIEYSIQRQSRLVEGFNQVLGEQPMPACRIIVSHLSGRRSERDETAPAPLHLGQTALEGPLDPERVRAASVQNQGLELRSGPVQLFLNPGGGARPKLDR